MSRWLFLTLCCFCLVAISAAPPARSATARPLAGACATDRDCQTGLSCTYVEGVMAGQCAAACNSSASCQERFGDESVCLGADVCARTCSAASDCPEGNVCNLYGWCESAPAD
jgi:hypothetical protein